MRGWLYFLQIHLRLNLRNRQAFFFGFLFPLFFLFLYGSVIGQGNPKLVGSMIPLLMVLTALTGALFSLPMGLVAARERGILRRYRLTPVSSAVIMGANLFTGYLTTLFSAAYQLLLAHWAYGVNYNGSLLYTWIFLTLTFLAFAGMGMIIAAFAETTQAAPAMAQIIFLPMMALSGMMFPVEFLPWWAQHFARYLPGGYAVHGLRAALLYGRSPVANWSDTLILATGSATAIFIAVQLFRWEPGEKVQPAGKRWALAALFPYLFAGLWVPQNYLSQTGTPLERTMAPRVRTLAFVGGTVIDGTGRAPIRDGVVVTSFNRIRAVGPASSVTLPEGSVQIDARGKTLIPGLVDSHAHLTAGALDRPLDQTYRPEVIERSLRQYLYCGVTTVRDLGSALEPLWSVRERERDEDLAAPHLLMSGPILCAGPGSSANSDGAAHSILSATRIVGDPLAAVQAVREAAARKLDAVKLIAGGRFLGAQFPEMEPATIQAIAAEAHGRGLRVAAHTATLGQLRAAAAAGVDEVEHGCPGEAIDDATLSLLARQRIVFCPTLGVLSPYDRDEEGAGRVDALTSACAPSALLRQLGVPGTPDLLPVERQEARLLATANANLRRCFERGVPLALGTDAGMPGVLPGPAVHREMELWVRAGIPPLEVIAAATAGGSAAVGRATTAGTLTPGMEADLVLLDGDPIQDISATRRVAAVLKAGFVTLRDRLLRN